MVLHYFFYKAFNAHQYENGLLTGDKSLNHKLISFLLWAGCTKYIIMFISPVCGCLLNFSVSSLTTLGAQKLASANQLWRHQNVQAFYTKANRGEHYECFTIFMFESSHYDFL